MPVAGGGYGYTAGYRTRLDLQQDFMEFDETVLGAKAGIMVCRMDVIEGGPWKNAVPRLKAPILWRDSTNDAFYSPSGPYAFKFSGGYVGVVPQAMLSLRLSRYLRWNHDVARFLVSNGLSHAGATSATSYLSTLSFIS